MIDTNQQGSLILSKLQSSQHPAFSRIQAISRRPIDSSSSSSSSHNLTNIVNTDSSQWDAEITSLHPPPRVVFSSLATTLSDAQNLAAQHRIDHDLNIKLARAARKANTEIYILISSGGASSTSWFPYLRMKGQVEESITSIGFKRTIILRPGLLLGRKEGRGAEGWLTPIARGLGYVHASLRDSWAQDADVVARAAVAAAIMALKDEMEDEVWVLEQRDILRLARN